LTLLVGLLTIVGFALCILPGIWLAVSLLVAMPAMLLERITVSQAINRSFALVRTRWWECFWVWLLYSLLNLFVTFAFTALLAGTLGRAVHGDVGRALTTTMSATIGALLTLPFAASAIIVLYFDLRIRKEGFDVQMALQRLDTARG
jgi:hypothetical protein